jgi:hypothetical protein
MIPERIASDTILVRSIFGRRATWGCFCGGMTTGFAMSAAEIPPMTNFKPVELSTLQEVAALCDLPAVPEEDANLARA